MSASQQALLGGALNVGTPPWNCAYKGGSLPGSILAFNLDGTVTSSGGQTFVGTAGYSRWFPSAPVSGAYWIRGTVTAGVLDAGAGTWRQINTNVTFQQNTVASNQSATLTFDISTTNSDSGIFWTSSGNIISRAL